MVISGWSKVAWQVDFEGYAQTRTARARTCARFLFYFFSFFFKVTSFFLRSMARQPLPTLSRPRAMPSPLYTHTWCKRLMYSETPPRRAIVIALSPNKPSWLLFCLVLKASPRTARRHESSEHQTWVLAHTGSRGTQPISPADIKRL